MCVYVCTSVCLRFCVCVCVRARGMRLAGERDLVMNRTTIVLFLLRTERTSNLIRFTKGLPRVAFERHRRTLMGEQPHVSVEE